MQKYILKIVRVTKNHIKCNIIVVNVLENIAEYKGNLSFQNRHKRKINKHRSSLYIRTLNNMFVHLKIKR